TADAGRALSESVAIDAQVVDFNHDGNFDVVLWSPPSGCQVLLNRGGAKFEAVASLPAVASPDSLFAFRGTVADLDGDGFDDLLTADATGTLHFIANRGERFEERALSFPSFQDRTLASLAPAPLSSPAKPNLLAFTSSGQF